MKGARVVPAAFLLGSIGCATLQPVEQPARFIPDRNPQVVYVTFKNESRVTLARPLVRGDSLVGTVEGVSHPVAAPLSHIQRVEALQRNPGRTRWLVVGIGALTVVGAFVLAQPAVGGELGCDATYYRSECYGTGRLGP